MSDKKKMGRPVEGEPKTEKIGIRISKIDLEKLEICSKKLNKSRSNVIIDGIRRTYREIED
ncbi:MAG: CopG family transcriptional regulator [Tissierellia bacterium]|nr:CopG family transcriptional regulator [Tissierellia bacterium]